MRGNYAPPPPVDSGWIAMTGYGTGWANYNNGFVIGRYGREGDRVFVEGRLICSAAIAANTPSTIFTFPPGFRPKSYTIPWTALAYGAAATIGDIRVSPAGVMQWASTTAVAANGIYTITGSFTLTD